MVASSASDRWNVAAGTSAMPIHWKRSHASTDGREDGPTEMTTSPRKVTVTAASTMLDVRVTRFCDLRDRL
ncbi:MAG: hypothetical protein M5R40_27790 [Anaerolineae bacterium]|nr:hypothetical protein [Anaerolineae bacterium]